MKVIIGKEESGDAEPHGQHGDHVSVDYDTFDVTVQPAAEVIASGAHGSPTKSEGTVNDGYLPDTVVSGDGQPSSSSENINVSFNNNSASSDSPDRRSVGHNGIGGINNGSLLNSGTFTSLDNEIRKMSVDFPKGASSSLNVSSANTSRKASMDVIKRKFSAIKLPHFNHHSGENDQDTSMAASYTDVPPILMHDKRERLPLKDFRNEVRAGLDIDRLLHQTVVLLNVDQIDQDKIFDRIIDELHKASGDKAEFSCKEVKTALFTRYDDIEYHIPCDTVQSMSTTSPGGMTFDYDQSWFTAVCTLPSVQHRYLAMARLAHPTNLGRNLQDVQFIILILAPVRMKGTKTALEAARTFGTIFSDMTTRQQLLDADTETQFKEIIMEASTSLTTKPEMNTKHSNKELDEAAAAVTSKLPVMRRMKKTVFGDNWYFGRGIKQDFLKRMKVYVSDYTDGLKGTKTILKVLSTTFFLYFACLLPAIAFGVLNSDNTDKKIDVKKVIYGQAIGGLYFALFGGQPMIIILTTAPLSIYIKLIHSLCVIYHLDFFAMYAWVGIWCQVFLILFAFTELSNILRWTTKSIEEMFSLFIAIAFVVGAFKALAANFSDNYYSPVCDNPLAICNVTNATNATTETIATLVCRRDSSMLHLFLMLGTLWVGCTLYNFTKTPFLTARKREMLADYALPVAVIFMSFLGSFVFRDIISDKFNYDASAPLAIFAKLFKIKVGAIFAAIGLGFSLAVLFFIDQYISSAIVDNPQNKVQKGSATHLDLLVVAILNLVLSLVGLPWMHAALPHSPLHVRALADVEDRVQQGHVYEVITKVRETRLAALIAHLLILLSAIFLLPSPLHYIPRPVLDGLFLYMAVSSLQGNEFFQRILLFFTEQAAYPPTHYIRRAPQKSVHMFTLCQLLQLGVLCAFGFVSSPYVKMVFPVVILLFLPIRHLLIPRIIPHKYLEALDGHHNL